MAATAAMALGLALITPDVRTARSQPAWDVGLRATHLPLDPRDPARVRLGRFHYAGGLLLAAASSSRLHGLSDIQVSPDGRLLAVTDGGDLLKARLQLDADGRLVGLEDAGLTPLIGQEGEAGDPERKLKADAEGLAVFANGDRLVSFEVDDRILFFPADGGRPRAAPMPNAAFPKNFGMEALAADPERGEDAYLVGGEVSGRIWNCRLSTGCTDGRKVRKGPLWGLTAVAPLPGGRTAYLLRGMATWFGLRARLQVVDADGELMDELALDPPLNTDNFEGVAAVPQDDGTVRFYLVSDDNFMPERRTLLMAFDWKPAP